MTPTPNLARPAWAEALPFESRFLDVADTRLHYVDEGRGPTVLMLPGSPMWAFMYRRAVERLRGRFRCVAVDLPGFGLSAAPVEWQRPFARASDLLGSFMRGLDLDGVTLVAHATSGPPGLSAALREPDRIRRLVISNTFAWPLDETPRLRWIARIVGSRPFGWLNVGLNLLCRLTARYGRRTGPFTPLERDAIAGPFASRRTRQHLQSFLRGLTRERSFFATLRERLPELRRFPSLLLFGRHDNGYQAGHLERWERVLGAPRSLVLESSGHFPMEDEPERFVEAVARFASG